MKTQQRGKRLSADKLADHRDRATAQMGKEQERIDLGFCPKCEPSFYLLEPNGCRVCPQCGWSACE